MGVFQTMPISFGHFPSENPPTFPALEPGKIPQFRRYFMKTGLNKRQKTTAIYLGSRCREFESPHSDHKNRCFRLKTAVFSNYYCIFCRTIAIKCLVLGLDPKICFSLFTASQNLITLLLIQFQKNFGISAYSFLQSSLLPRILLLL